jgi:hypothetical protein
VGQEFLHRLVVALHLVVGLVVGGGIRPVIRILELVGLDAFVAGSLGSHHGLAKELEQHVGKYGETERSRLAESMTPKAISVCQDETFHPETCLVAIEPVSNFILVEQYVEQRDSKTWTEAMGQALSELPVVVVQSASDEGKAILGHARELSAHHSPDVFHVQHEAAGATSLALARQVRKAEEAFNQSSKELDQAEHQASQAHRPSPALDLDPSTNQALMALLKADQAQKRNREAILGIALDYHPVDLATGQPRTADEVAQCLQGRFDTLRDVATHALLSKANLDKLDKAERVLPAMKATIAWYYDELRKDAHDLDLPPGLSTVLTQYLAPAAYLERASNRAPHADEREALRDTADARRRDGYSMLALLGVDAQQRSILEQTAAAAADRFQRSSSCVEGRNGQLSLRHHHLHQISPQRLQALTAIHNYFTKRSDGTTAAERFFGNEPKDLFEHLLTCTRPPPRPAAKRPPRTNLSN